MVCAAAITAVGTAAVASATSVTRTASAEATAAAVVSAPASTTAAVEATASATTAVETAAPAATTVTATTTLRKCSRRAKQRHRSDCREENLKISGPVHGCYLHPTTSQAARAAGTPRPFYTN
jgi:hypothetical protein